MSTEPSRPADTLSVGRRLPGGRKPRHRDYVSIRTETDAAFGRLFSKTGEADKGVADRVAEVAKTRGVPRAQIALA
jgi:1-deoxyxylulose-5-phosphate synthase